MANYSPEPPPIDAASPHSRSTSQIRRGSGHLVRPLRTFMDYQLVFQFRGDSLQDFDAMVALEDELIAELGDSANVDGHDFGAGTGNIFSLFRNVPVVFHWAG